MSRKATRCAVAAIGTVIAGAVLAGAAPAAAEQHTGEVGTITLCSHGSYASSIKFPNRDGLFTMVVPPGRCEITILRNSGVEEIHVFGHEGPAMFWLHTGHYDLTDGQIVETTGIPAAARVHIS